MWYIATWIVVAMALHRLPLKRNCVGQFGNWMAPSWMEGVFESEKWKRMDVPCRRHVRDRDRLLVVQVVDARRLVLVRDLHVVTVAAETVDGTEIVRVRVERGSASRLQQR